MAITITLRSVKGSPLTIPEVDTNFSNLKNGIDGQQAAVDAAVAAVNGMDSRVDALEAASTDYGNRIVALETGGGGGGGFSSNGFFVGLKNANQSAPVNSSPYSIKVSYSVESADVDGGYDPATSLVTAPATGWYSLLAALRLDATSLSTPLNIGVSLFFKINGAGIVAASEHFFPDETSTNGQTISTSGAVHLSAGDTVATYFESVCTGGSMTWHLTADPAKSHFEGWRVA